MLPNKTMNPQSIKNSEIIYKENTMQSLTSTQLPILNHISLETFKEIIIKIKHKAHTSGLSSEEHILYNLIRNLPKDRGFTHISDLVEFRFLSMIKSKYRKHILSDYNLDSFLLEQYNITTQKESKMKPHS